VLEFIGKRLRYLQEVQREERGFTLIELLVVVAIIGILVAIALPVFLGQRAKASDARAQANVREAATAINVYFTEEGQAPAGSPFVDAGVPLAGYGFNGSDPDVKLVATGTADTATWCVSTPSNGGESAFWWQTQAMGDPEGGAALPAGC
jgi:type IV pilus assembly protein PilA